MRLITILILTSFKLTAAIPDNLALIEIATANLPLAFVSPYDGTERMFIVEQGGVIKVLKAIKLQYLLISVLKPRHFIPIRAFSVRH